MVENFVEKYIPVRIQSQISETLQTVLPYKEIETLLKYEKDKFKDLHQTILDDDGIPDLFKSLRQIRMTVGYRDKGKFDDYEGVHAQRRARIFDEPRSEDSFESDRSGASGKENQKQPETNEQQKQKKTNSRNPNDNKNVPSSSHGAMEHGSMQPSLKKTKNRSNQISDGKSQTELTIEKKKAQMDKITEKSHQKYKLDKSEKKAQ